MCRYNILSGTLLILSIIDFALAAPVSGQEKHGTNVESKDMVNVLGKRMDVEEEALLMWGHVVDDEDLMPEVSWGLYTPPGPSLPRPNPGISPPATPRPGSPRPGLGSAPDPASLNPTSSTAKPGTTLDTIPEWAESSSEKDGWNWDFEPNRPHSYESDEEFMKAHALPPNESPGVDATSSNKEPEDYGPNWPHDASEGESSGYDSDREFIKKHARPVDPSISSWIDTDSMSSDPDLDWDYWVNSKDPVPPRPASSKESGQPHGDQAPSPSAGPPTEPGQEAVTTPSLTGAGH